MNPHFSIMMNQKTSKMRPIAILYVNAEKTMVNKDELSAIS